MIRERMSHRARELMMVQAELRQSEQMIIAGVKAESGLDVEFMLEKSRVGVDMAQLQLEACFKAMEK